MQVLAVNQLPDFGWGTVYFGDAESRTSWWDKIDDWQLKLRNHGLFHAALLTPEIFLLTNLKFLRVHEREKQQFGESIVTALIRAGVLVPAFRDNSYKGFENAYERFTGQGQDRMVGVRYTRELRDFAFELDQALTTVTLWPSHAGYGFGKVLSDIFRRPNSPDEFKKLFKALPTQLKRLVPSQGEQTDLRVGNFTERFFQMYNLRPPDDIPHIQREARKRNHHEIVKFIDVLNTCYLYNQSRLFGTRGRSFGKLLNLEVLKFLEASHEDKSPSQFTADPDSEMKVRVLPPKSLLRIRPQTIAELRDSDAARMWFRSAGDYCKVPSNVTFAELSNQFSNYVAHIAKQNRLEHVRGWFRHTGVRFLFETVAASMAILGAKLLEQMTADQTTSESMRAAIGGFLAMGLEYGPELVSQRLVSFVYRPEAELEASDYAAGKVVTRFNKTRYVLSVVQPAAS